MTINERRKAKKVIWILAKRNKVSVSAIRASMKEAMDEAWNASFSSPESKAAWNKYFPDGKKPSVEEFIIQLSSGI